MEGARLAKKIYIGSITNSRWGEICRKIINSMLDGCIKLLRVGIMSQWRLNNRNRDGFDWDESGKMR